MTGFLCIADISPEAKEPNIGITIFRNREHAERWCVGGAAGVVEINAASHLHKWSPRGRTQFSPMDQSYAELARLLSEAGVDLM